MKDIVITGEGIISPIGFTVKDFWQSILDGKSGIKPITKFDTTKHLSKLFGEVQGFDLKQFVREPAYLRMDEYIQYALAAAEQAINDADKKFIRKPKEGKETGIFYGTSSGPTTLIKNVVDQIHKSSPGAVEPFLFQQSVFNAPASAISIKHKIKGPVHAFPIALNSGITALDCGVNLLNNERITCAIAGCSDTYSELIHKSYTNLNLLSPADGGEEHLCPFDKRRNGYIFGEGAAFVIAESLEHALERDVPIHGKIISVSLCSSGDSLNCDTLTSSGYEMAMKTCLDYSPYSYKDIDFIVSMGTSRVENDIHEAEGIHSIFRERANSIPIVNIMSYIGTGTASLFFANLIAAFHCMKDGVLPPVLNYQEKDEACDLNIVTDFIEGNWNRAIINSSSFGGLYGSVLIEKYTE